MLFSFFRKKKINLNQIKEPNCYCNKEIQATCTKIKGLTSTWEGLCIGEKVFLTIETNIPIQLGNQAIFYINPDNRSNYQLKQIIE